MRKKKKKKDYIGLKRYHWLNKRVEVKGIKRGFLEIRQPGLSGRLTRQRPKGLLWLLIKNITLNPMSPTSLEVVDEESTYRGLFEGRGKPSWPPWCAYLMLYAHSLIPPASLGFISTSTRFLGEDAGRSYIVLGPTAKAHDGRGVSRVRMEAAAARPRESHTRRQVAWTQAGRIAARPHANAGCCWPDAGLLRVSQ